MHTSKAATELLVLFFWMIYTVNSGKRKASGSTRPFLHAVSLRRCIFFFFFLLRKKDLRCCEGEIETQAPLSHTLSTLRRKAEKTLYQGGQQQRNARDMYHTTRSRLGRRGCELRYTNHSRVALLHFLVDVVRHSVVGCDDGRVRGQHRLHPPSTSTPHQQPPADSATSGRLQR